MTTAKQKVTLKNDYHNTEVTIIVRDGDELSKAQMRRVESTLCGMADCHCGIIRGQQDVSVEPLYNYEACQDAYRIYFK